LRATDLDERWFTSDTGYQVVAFNDDLGKYIESQEARNALKRT